jgi:hypothetical protein
VRFCPWYPLDEAGAHAPAGPGVFQVRLPAGLLDYPTGKSAMVHYELAEDVRAAATQYAEAHAQRGWLCRHTVEIDGDLAVLHARLVRDFRARFGAAPRPMS